MRLNVKSALMFLYLIQSRPNNAMKNMFALLSTNLLYMYCVIYFSYNPYCNKGTLPIYIYIYIYISLLNCINTMKIYALIFLYILFQYVCVKEDKAIMRKIAIVIIHVFLPLRDNAFSLYVQ